MFDLCRYNLKRTLRIIVAYNIRKSIILSVGFNLQPSMSARRRRSPVKGFFVKLGRLIKLIFLSLVGLSLVIVSIWLLLPHLLGLDQTKNYVFTQLDQKEELSSVYLVSFQPLANQISFQPLSLKLEADIYVNQELQTETLSYWWQNYFQTIDSEQQAKLFGWLLNNRVDRVVMVPEDLNLEKSVNLVSILRKLALNQSIDWLQRKEMLKLYAAAKGAEITQQDKKKQVQNIELPIIDEGGCSLAVINTTQISGLAGQVGGIAENMGARVIRIDSNDLDLEQSKLVVKNLSKCRTVFTLMRQVLLGQPKRVEDEKQMDQLLSRFRADFVVLIGSDQSLVD